MCPGGFRVKESPTGQPVTSQLIWLGIRQQSAKLDLSTKQLASTLYLRTVGRYNEAASWLLWRIGPTIPSAVQDLGVTLDEELTFAPHFHHFCRKIHIPLEPTPHWCSLAYSRCLRYTHPFIKHSSTTAHAMLASELMGWGAWTGSCVLSHASLDAFPTLTMSL